MIKVRVCTPQIFEHQKRSKMIAQKNRKTTPPTPRNVSSPPAAPMLAPVRSPATAPPPPTAYISSEPDPAPAVEEKKKVEVEVPAKTIEEVEIKAELAKALDEEDHEMTAGESSADEKSPDEPASSSSNPDEPQSTSSAAPADDVCVSCPDCQALTILKMLITLSRPKKNGKLVVEVDSLLAANLIRTLRKGCDPLNMTCLWQTKDIQHSAKIVTTHS